MDEIEQGTVQTVGERLREARDAQGLSLEEIAATTRIPTRHLQSLENSEWTALPAPTYSMGFAKNYATAVGLDKAEIAEQLRAEMGGTRPTQILSNDLFEPADPTRAMPKGLVIGALIALVVVALGLTWLSNRGLSGGGDAATPADGAIAAAPNSAPITPLAPAPVVITANEPAWIEVRDGATILAQKELATGQSFEVPASAVAPTLTTAKAEALRISVGTADAPQVGPAGRKVSDVSLKAADLLRGPQPASAPAVDSQPVRSTRATSTRSTSPTSTTPASPAIVTPPDASPPVAPANTTG